MRESNQSDGKIERASGFPKVVGAIDGMYIKIITSAQEDKQSDVNCKGYHSIHVQVRI